MLTIPAVIRRTLDVSSSGNPFAVNLPIVIQSVSAKTPIRGTRDNKVYRFFWKLIQELESVATNTGTQTGTIRCEKVLNCIHDYWPSLFK